VVWPQFATQKFVVQSVLPYEEIKVV